MYVRRDGERLIRARFSRKRVCSDSNGRSMWNMNPIRDQAMRLAANRTLAGPMYDFISGTLAGLQQFLASERALLDSLETKYAGSGGSGDWEKVRAMLAQRIAQLEAGVAECERVLSAARSKP